MNRILETSRLYLREMSMDDFADIASILQDDETMSAYEGAFSDTEVNAWIQNQQRRYKEDGFGLWAVILKEEEILIGQCGLTYQMYDDNKVVEAGYLFNKEYWHQGYAIESAQACRDYAFNELRVDNVYSIIRDTNTASQNVAVRNGMARIDSFVKYYRNVEMPHYVYRIEKDR